MKKLFFTLLLAAAVLPGWAGRKYPDVLYAIGTATSTDWNFDGSSAKIYETTSNSKKYEGFVNFDTNGGLLKFMVEYAWNEGQWGAQTNELEINSNSVRTYFADKAQGDSNDDKKFKFNLETGLYLVTVDLTTENDEKVTFKKWTSSDVFEIGTLGQLKAFADGVNKFDPSINAKLTADISDAMDFAIGWHDSDDSHKWYSGEFDGNYHTINLNIDKQGDDNQGLFGAITGGAYIHDVTVAGSVKGHSYIAGIVGSVRRNSGGDGGEVNIFNCKNTATITSYNKEGSGATNAGGIVGVTMKNGGYCKTNISYCCNTGNVYGKSDSGLISGWIGNGSIKHTFASGTLEGAQGGNDKREFSRYDTCDFYANVTMTGSTETGGASYFNPSDATYTISDAEKFLAIATMVNVGGLTSKNFTLNNDIDLNGKVFTPIGNDNYMYAGTFDGQGHKVTLALDNKTENNQGLFGVITNGASISNVITAGSVNGQSYVGGIVGAVAGGGNVTVSNCGNEATITTYGGRNGAGIIGVNIGKNSITIQNCYNQGDIIGNPANGTDDTNNLGEASKGEVAALCAWIGDLNLDGRNNYAKNCYNTGEVKVYSNTNKNYISYQDFIRRNIGTLGAEETHLVNNYNLKVNITENREAINNGSNNGTYYGIAITNEDVTSGALCAKLGFGFRQNLGSGSPCFDQAQGFVAQIGEARYSTMFNTHSDVEIPTGIEAFVGVITGSGENQNLSLTSLTGNIAKDEPVVLKLKDGVTPGFFNFTPTSGATKSTSNDLVGSNGNADVDKGGDGVYALAQKGDPAKVGFYPVGSSVKIPEGRAYLKITSGGGVKGFTFVFDDDDATGIENLNVNDNLNEGAIYNLAGQRINKMQRGINIVNGKKILK